MRVAEREEEREEGEGRGERDNKDEELLGGERE